MRIVSWNVNGIRAAIRKGLDKFISSIDADIWMLQEVRCLPEQLPKDWNAYSQYSYEATPLDTKYVSGKEVLKFRDHAFQTYFASEKYLKLVRSKFGEKCYNHMISQPKVPLRRKLLEEDKVV